MAQADRETRLRAELSAAAAILGVPIEVVVDRDWSVRDGVAVVGLDSLAADGNTELAVARTLLLLWESVREVRTAPLRRARRLALSRMRPELEVALAALDRMLALIELRIAMPHLRESLAAVVRGDLPEGPAELSRHVQWVVLGLAVTAGIAGLAEYGSQLDRSVLAEFEALGKLGGAASGAEVLRVALHPDAGESVGGGIPRFERAYACVVVPYERLLRLDLAEVGLADAGAVPRSGDDLVTDEAGADLGLGLGSGSEAQSAPNEAQEGEIVGEATGDGDEETARAGDHREGAEGADLFEAERAGFVQTVLDTPLPASGAWVEGLRLPDTALAAGSDPHAARLPQSGSAVSRTGAAGLREYHQKCVEFAPHIDALREAWRQVITERVAPRSTISRWPEPEGEMLDRDSLVRIVSEVMAGVERPRAFVSRRTLPRRTRREGSTDYVLLIDRSASMQGRPAEAAADAALIMLESLAAVARDIEAEERALGLDLELSIRTSLIVFDALPVVVKPLSGALNDDTRSRIHLETRAPRGSTNDALALAAAARELGVARAGRSGEPQPAQPGASGMSLNADGIERRRVVIVVSDGGTDDPAAVATQLALLRRADVSVFGIGIATSDLVQRYAPHGMRLSEPGELAPELMRLVSA